jgi:hypothetical protein
MYATSVLWAALFLVQAAGTALVVSQASYSTACNLDQTLPFVATALGIVGSIMIGRHVARRGRASAAVTDVNGATGQVNGWKQG